MIEKLDPYRDLEMHWHPENPKKSGAALTIDDTQGVVDMRNRLFPGWWTYGGEMSPESQYWQAIRNRIYPGWWTTRHSELPTELKSLYMVVCGNQAMANVAIFVQPRNIRARLELLYVKSPKDINWVELVKPPFVRVEVDSPSRV